MSRVGALVARRGNLRLVLAILSILAIVLGAHAAVTTTVSVADSPNPAPSDQPLVLRVGVGPGGPDTLNPLTMIDTISFELSRLTYNFLVGFSSSGFKPEPELATAWTQSEDGRTWTFDLREDVSWSDGQPFTAKDVAFTFNFILENRIGNFIDYLVSLDEVVVVDDHTVKFICAKPKPNMLSMPVPILPEHVWGRFTGEEAQHFRNERPVGTGPFQLVEHDRNSLLRLKANTDYWKGRPKIDELHYIIHTNPTTMAGELRNGQLDAIEGVPDAQTFLSLQSDPNLTTIAGAQNGYEAIDINCYDDPRSLGNPVLRDAQFRQALQYAIDRDKIVEVSYRGLTRPGMTIVPPHFYDPSLDYHWEPPAEDRYQFDLAKADELLTAAGYPLANDVRVDKRGRPILLRLFTATGIETTPKLFVGWMKQLGIKVEFSVLDAGALEDRIYNTVDGQPAPDFDFFMWGAVTGDVDPNWIHSIFTTGQIGSWSWNYWSDSQYDALFKRQGTEMDPQKRKELFWAMQKLVYEQSPCLMFVHPSSLEAYNTAKWTGWIHTPSDEGTVLYAQENIDTFLSVRPTATTEQSAANSSRPWLIAIVGLAVAVVIGVGVVVRRRRGKALEQE